MPVTRCSENSRPGFRWGSRGKCYTYTAGNAASRSRARSRARRQGRAIEASGSKAFDDILRDPLLWELLREDYLDTMRPIWREAFLKGAELAAEERPVREGSKEVALLLARGEKRLPFDPGAILSVYDIFVAQYENPQWLAYADATREALDQLVQRAARELWTVEELIEGLEPIFSPARAHRIAATELTNVMGGGAVATYTEAGFPEWEWRTVRDPFVCPICQPRNGQRFPTAVPFQAAHPHCRCWPVPAGPQFGQELDDTFAPGEKKGTNTMQLHRLPSGRWSAERVKLHDAIIEDALRNVPESANPTVYMMGGGPASGKSSVLNSSRVDIPRHRVDIDPDAIKAKLPEYQAMLAAGDSRAAAFAHAESSYLSQRMMDEATARNLDVLLDGTGDKSLEELTSRIGRYRQNGHRVVAHYVTVDTELAVARSEARAAETGRRVPPSYIRQAHAEISDVMPQAMNQGAFDELTLWDTDVPLNTDPNLILTHGDGLTTIHDERRWQDFLAKANQ